MLYHFLRKKLCRHLMVGGVLCAAGLVTFSCSDKYDLDSDQPSGLNSIYGYIQQQGNYTYCLKLINDLDQTDILSKTGSKTLFIADDAAYRRFFESNSWDVHSYDDLSLVQKKLLLNASMVDNPYTTSLLSTAASDEGPVPGEVFRRSNSVSLFDSVTVVQLNDPKGILPESAVNNLRATHESVLLFRDDSNAPPMLHFTPKFLSTKKILSTDIDFLYNQDPGTRKQEDVYVNNAKVILPNVFCKNGFVHKVDEVVLPLDNMAEVIRQHDELSLFSSLLERFAAVDYSESLTQTYNQNKKTNVDSVYIKRYYSDRSAGSMPDNGGVAFETDKNNIRLDGSLQFDPGWNAYNSGSKAKGDNPMMADMGVMLVPTNDALNEWWENGAGKVLREFYGSWENVPISTIAKQLRNSQLSNFTSSLPSMFSEIKNDAQEEMKIKEKDIDHVYLACNGAIYVTNKVFTSTYFSSVLFPTLVDTENLSLISNAIEKLDYSAYLNSMVSEYIFLIPTNEGLLSYIDPVSYGQNSLYLWEFSSDPAKTATSTTYLRADVYRCTLNSDGTVTKGDRVTSDSPSLQPEINKVADGKDGVFKNRFEDLLDNSIIIEPYQSGKKYYKTKGNSFVRVDGVTEGSSVYGSWQAETNRPLSVKRQYHMDNGDALMLDGLVLGTRLNVAKTLAQHDEFSEFLALLQSSGALSLSNSKDKWQAGSQTAGYGNLFNLKEAGSVGAEDAKSDKATYLLNNFHYTLYAPTNAAMQEAYAAGLPTPEMLADADAWDGSFKDATEGMEEEEIKAYAASLGGVCLGDSADRVKEAMLDFVKYHIQDNSIFIDAGFKSGAYESGKTELIRSTDEDDVEKSALDLTNGTFTKNGQTYEIVRDNKGNPTVTYNAETETYSVQYYTGKYSPGRPYKLNVNVSSSSLSVNGISVDTSHGLYNLMAQEYWFTGDPTTPYEAHINNSSSVVIHAINKPLLYDAPAQFKYKYKPITSSNE